MQKLFNDDLRLVVDPITGIAEDRQLTDSLAGKDLLTGGTAVSLQTVKEPLQTAQNLLKGFATAPDFSAKMQVAFGNSFNVADADALAKAWVAGNISSFPKIEIRNYAEINGAKGAFAAANNTIYLSREFLTENAANTETVASVLLEEIAHAVDTQLNDADTPGDEGEIFSALVRGEKIEAEQLQRIKAEDDTASIILDGEVVQIEQAVNVPFQSRIGGVEGDTEVIKLGGTQGEINLSYRTFTIPDKVQLLYEGKVIFDSGFESTGGLNPSENPPPKVVKVPFKGNSDEVTLILTANQDDARTEWDYSVDTSNVSSPNVSPPGGGTGNTGTPPTGTGENGTTIDIPNKHTLYEFLAKDTVYKNFDTANLPLESQVFKLKAQDKESFSYKDFLPSDIVQEYGYKIDKIFNEEGKRKTGFYALGLTSDKGKPPVLVLRGTDLNPDELFADVFADADARGVGFNQFENNQQEVIKWLEDKKRPDIDIVGHSLGGALAQMLAAEFTEKGGQLGEIVTFNSPGISKQQADKFRRGLVESVKHYIAAGDFVSLGGEEFLQGSYEIFSASDWADDKDPIIRTLNGFTNRHLNPLLVEDVGYNAPLKTNDAIKKTSGLASQKYDTVTWLNSPLFTYLDPEFLTLMAVASTSIFSLNAANTLPEKPTIQKLGSLALNSSLFFRGKVEEIRTGVDNFDVGGNRYVGSVRLGGNLVPALRELASAANTNFLNYENGLIGIPVPPFQLGGVRLEPSGFSIKKEDKGLKLQGKASLIFPLGVGLSRFTADLAGDNFFRIKDSGFDVVGALSVDNILIVPDVWEIRQAKLEYNSIENKVGGQASILIPNHIGIGGLLEFENGQLNSLAFDVDGLNLPVFNTGLNLRRIKGGVKDLTKPDQIVFNGGVRFTNVGQEINIPLPSWAGGNQSVSILDIDIDGSLNRDRLKADGIAKVLGGILGDGKATAELNWNKGFLEVRDFNLSALGGFVKAQANFKANTNLDLTMGGNATLQVPQNLPIPNELGLFAEVIRKYQREPLQQGGFEIQYSNDGKLSNDYLSGWAKLPGLPVDLTLTLFLDGNYALRPGAKNIPETNSFIVNPSTNWVILGANWENAANNVPIQVKLPNGTILNESDFAANNITVVNDLTGSNTKGVIVYNPTPGVWDINVLNPTGLGNVRYSAFRDAVKPVVEVTNLSSNSTGSEVTINYKALDADSNAEVSLFYDTDNQGFDGIPIIRNLAESDGAGSFVWNTEGLPTGDYYVYSIIRDENNPPVFSYSTQQVKVTESTDLSVSKIASADPVVVGNNVDYTITVTNKGTNNAKGVTLIDTLPEDVTFVSASVNPTQQLGDDLIFDLSNLNNGETKTVKVTVTPQTTGTITSTAKVTSKTFDSDVTNNVAILDTSVDPITTDLALSATGITNTVDLGKKLTYNFSVTNNSPTTATGVTLTDNLPSGVKDVSTTSSKGLAAETNGIVTAELGELNSGETATVTVTATSIAADTFTKTTTVTSNEIDSNSANNSLIQRTIVNPVTPTGADLELTKIVDKANPNVGDQITFTLTLTNKGPGIASSVKVTDILPTGLNFVSANSIQGTYDSNTGVWDVGNIRDNLTRTLNIVAKVNNAGIIPTTAAVTAVSETDSDSTPNNNNPNEDDQASVTINAIGGVQIGTTNRLVFDDKTYLTLYPDVRDAYNNGGFEKVFDHFTTHGILENRDLRVRLFDETYYIGQNTDVKQAVDVGGFDNAFDHFILWGVNEGRKGSSSDNSSYRLLFDENYYLGQNPDVKAGVDDRGLYSGLIHYFEAGQFEGRKISFSDNYLISA
ncbi:lipase family protein [Argonema galeatum]|uniref:lipase family protein n=1 Tax=Argonema galeatum TaxID=2942762 RepID=UPI0020120765|nr:CARDB domain-containing protein [Argonema galeatum]MCL1462940.1 DUF11 domain-containing protein [Argonema galeatum A003/A1]